MQNHHVPVTRKLGRQSPSRLHVVFLVNPISRVRWVVCCCRGELVLYCDLDSEQKCTLPWPWLHKTGCLGNSTVPRTGRARSFGTLTGSHTGLPCIQGHLSFPQGASRPRVSICDTERGKGAGSNTEADRKGGELACLCPPGSFKPLEASPAVDTSEGACSALSHLWLGCCWRGEWRSSMLLASCLFAITRQSFRAGKVTPGSGTLLLPIEGVWFHLWEAHTHTHTHTHIHTHSTPSTPRADGCSWTAHGLRDVFPGQLWKLPWPRKKPWRRAATHLWEQMPVWQGRQFPAGHTEWEPSRGCPWGAWPPPPQHLPLFQPNQGTAQVRSTSPAPGYTHMLITNPHQCPGWKPLPHPWLLFFLNQEPTPLSRQSGIPVLSAPPWIPRSSHPSLSTLPDNDSRPRSHPPSPDNCTQDRYHQYFSNT